MRLAPQIETTVAEDAYAAGLFDGEGCLQIRGGKKSRARAEWGHYSLTANAANTALPVLLWMQERYGGSVFTKPRGVVGWRQAYYWIVCGKSAAAFLAKIEPYVIVKRDQVVAGLVFGETLDGGAWRHNERPGRPLTDGGSVLRGLAYRAFRAAMNATGGKRPRRAAA